MVEISSQLVGSFSLFAMYSLNQQSHLRLILPTSTRPIQSLRQTQQHPLNGSLVVVKPGETFVGSRANRADLIQSVLEGLSSEGFLLIQ